MRVRVGVGVGVIVGVGVDVGGWMVGVGVRVEVARRVSDSAPAPESSGATEGAHDGDEREEQCRL